MVDKAKEWTIESVKNSIVSAITGAGGIVNAVVDTINKKIVCIGFVLFFLAAIGAGCATQAPPPEQGSHLKIQSGESSAELSWPK